MTQTDTYAQRAIRQPADVIVVRHHNLGEHADACLSWPEVPGYQHCYLYLYPDGSIAACPIEGRPSAVIGRDLIVLTTIFRACAELPNPCPCPLVCCPDAHLRYCKCGATSDLVLVGDLPLTLRRAWCRTCHRRWQLDPPDYARPPA